MRSLVPLLLLALAGGVAAHPAVDVARLVHDETVAVEPLTAALASKDPLVRATAARVAMARGVTAAIPALRTALSAEQDADAAREVLRALVLLGSDEDVALAAGQLARFPAAIDDAFGDAVSRLGAPRALTLYDKYETQLRGPAFSSLLAFWGRAPQATAAASRYLGANDATSFRTVVGAFTESKLTLDPGVATAAVQSPNDDIRAAVLWHLAVRAADKKDDVPAELLALGAQRREGAPPAEAFARELLSRVQGNAPREDTSWLLWIGDQSTLPREIPAGFDRLLTKREWAAAGLGDKPSAKEGTIDSVEIVEPSFTLPIVVPRGLPQALFSTLKCRGSWIGVAPVTVDRAGRVLTLDSAAVTADTPQCEQVLRTVTRLSLAHPTSFRSSFVAPVVFLQVKDVAPCMDESPVANRPVSVRPVHSSSNSDIKAPKVKRRVEPAFPESARIKMGNRESVLVVAESIISATGCVRSLRLLKQSPYPEVNTAALVALSKWKFEPATLNGAPVDVIFNLAINFKTN